MSSKTPTSRRSESPSERAMTLGLRALNAFAGLEVVDRMGLREPAARAIRSASKQSFRAAATGARTFNSVQKLGKPARLPSASGGSKGFDITPDDEQKMLREAFSDFASEMIRPAAAQANVDCATATEVLEQANELGLAMLGVPEELGGAVSERSAVTTVLAAEALAHGDMGIAFAALAPSAVSGAIGLWGNADQQARYLHEFTGENVPAAALAMLEPRPLFDPFTLQTTATKTADGYELSGTKSLVPRVAEAELFVVAAQIEGSGPALFIVESSAEGIFTEPEPAMGLRPAATGRLILENVKVSADALLGDGAEQVYADAVQLGRIGWCALAVGASQAVLDYVIPYVNERVAFGEPISNRQSVAFAVADMGIELEGMRLLTYRAASRADQGKTFAREAALARRLCAEKAMMIGSQGVQLLGGHGYTKEHPVERWYRDLRAAGLMEGALLV